MTARSWIARQYKLKYWAGFMWLVEVFINWSYKIEYKKRAIGEFLQGGLDIVKINMKRK